MFPPNIRFEKRPSGQAQGPIPPVEGVVQVVPAEQGQAPVPVRAMGYDGRDGHVR